jgi:hypothetical protein
MPLALLLALAVSPAAARNAAPLRFVEVRSPSGFTVSLPTAPWTVAMSDVDGALEAAAPATKAAPAGVMTVQPLETDKGAAARFLAETCQGAAASTRRGKAGVFRVAEGQTAFRTRIVEQPLAVEPVILKARCGVVEAGGKTIALTWTAPPAANPAGHNVFDKPVETLALEK